MSAPINAIIFAEIMHEAGVPKGVFNLVNGDGPSVGQKLAEHPDVDMMSFTGSARAGIIVAKAAADTVKRVAQELGGESANILLPDVDLEAAVRHGVSACFINSGQSCDAATRMLVPRALHDEAVTYAVDEALKQLTGDPWAEGAVLGPLVTTSGGGSKQVRDESRLGLHVATADVVDLPLSDHRHSFVAGQRSSGGRQTSEAEPRPHQPLSLSMILLDDVVEVFALS